MIKKEIMHIKRIRRLGINPLTFSSKYPIIKMENFAKRDNEDKEFRVVKVDDKKQLQTLKQYLNFYYDLGYNEEKYFKYYQQGKLDDKLRKRYNDTGVEAAKEYLEEKGPTLVKRKKTK